MNLRRGFDAHRAISEISDAIVACKVIHMRARGKVDEVRRGAMGVG